LDDLIEPSCSTGATTRLLAGDGDDDDIIEMPNVMVAWRLAANDEQNRDQTSLPQRRIVSDETVLRSSNIFSHDAQAQRKAKV
jgi:hypothetical protein